GLPGCNCGGGRVIRPREGVMVAAGVGQRWGEGTCVLAGNKLKKMYSTRFKRPGHLAARLGCAETKVATWDDLAFKLITLRLKKAQEKDKIGSKPDKNGKRDEAEKCQK
nr:hypothetical protein [Tanacetum cinerariifolium]